MATLPHPAGSFDHIYAQFRQSFFEELPERLDRIARLALTPGRGNPPSRALLDDIYREAHSIKGSSTTFGVHTITAISHRLEDYLRLLISAAAADAAAVGAMTGYVDLMRESMALAVDGGGDEAELERKLDALHASLEGNRPVALLVLNAKVTAQICREVLKDLDIRTVGSDDPIEALQRALTESFDLVIASSELGRLRGEALVAAVRFSPYRRRPPKTILVSTVAVAKRPNKRNTDPDHILSRDADLMGNLRRIVESMPGGRGGGAERSHG